MKVLHKKALSPDFLLTASTIGIHSTLWARWMMFVRSQCT